jgi:hypothetical protein
MRLKILLKRDGGVLFDYLYNMKKFEEYGYRLQAHNGISSIYVWLDSTCLNI